MLPSILTLLFCTVTPQADSRSLFGLPRIDLLESEGGGATQPAGPDRRVFGSLAILPRITRIEGQLDSELELNYEDLWGTGFGVSIEGGVHFLLGDKGWSIGASALLGYEGYSGDSTEDIDGDTWEADSLSITRLLFGFKAMYTPDKGLFFDARLAAGPVFYGRGEATLTFGGTDYKFTLFERSTVFAGELSAHIGYSAPKVWIAVGPSLRVQGRPEENKDFPLIDSENPLIFAFEVDFGFRF